MPSKQSPSLGAQGKSIAVSAPNQKLPLLGWLGLGTGTRNQLPELLPFSFSNNFLGFKKAQAVAGFR